MVTCYCLVAIIPYLLNPCLVQVFEGYGQTECTAGATFSLPGDFSVGHVGAPLPCNFIKLVDVPEMDYFSKNNEGEVRDPMPLQVAQLHVDTELMG